MIAEPRLAAHMPAAPHAHARIDDWETATGLDSGPARRRRGAGGSGGVTESRSGQAAGFTVARDGAGA
jgi:hypothetical protein